MNERGGFGLWSAAVVFEMARMRDVIDAGASVEVQQQLLEKGARR